MANYEDVPLTPAYEQGDDLSDQPEYGLSIAAVWGWPVATIQSKIDGQVLAREDPETGEMVWVPADELTPVADEVLIGMPRFEARDIARGKRTWRTWHTG
jgi:hypothetical protein